MNRERARQICKEVETQVNEAASPDLLSHLFLRASGRLKPIHSTDELRTLVQEHIPLRQRSIIDLLFYLFIRNSDYTYVNGFYLSPLVKDLVIKTKQFALQCSDDVGLVDESQLRSSLPANLSTSMLRRLYTAAGLHFHWNRVSLKSSDRAQVKALLDFLGHAVDIEGVSILLGWPQKRAGGSMANLKSVTRVKRSGWTIEQESLEPYPKIEAELIRQIDRVDGFIADKYLAYLVSQKLEIKEKSVFVYLSTERFKRSWDGDGGYHIVGPKQIRLSKLEQNVDGFNEQKEPFLDFSIKRRYFKGYSLVNVPFEFAVHAGCELDGNCTVEAVDLPSEVSELTVQCRLGSTTKAYIGKIRPALQHLEARVDQILRVSIVAPFKIRLVLIDPPQDDQLKSIESKVS